MTTPSIDLNELARRYSQATSEAATGSMPGVGINNQGRIVPVGEVPDKETSEIPQSPFAT